MDLLNKQSTALADRWRALSLGARLSVGLLLLLAVASVALLATRHEHGPEMYLLRGEPVAADQLPRMEAAFAKAGLSDYEIDAGRVRIPRARHTAYMAALAAGDALPRNFGEILDQAVRQTNPWINRAQQEELLKNARQNELAAIIQKMKGVQEASVLYDREKKQGLSGGERITASVTIKPLENQSLKRQQVLSIRKLVAGAIAGLDERSIAVIDLGSGHCFDADLADNALADGVTADAERTASPAPTATAADHRSTIHSAQPDQLLATWTWARENCAMLGVGGVALVGVLLVRSLYRGTPQRPGVAGQLSNNAFGAEVSTDVKPPVNEPLPSVISAAQAAQPDEPAPLPIVAPTPQRVAARLTPPALSPAPSDATLRDDLAEIVRDDPHAAARVLRSWISSPN